MADTLASVCVLVDRVIRNLRSFPFKEINWISGMKSKLLSIMETLYYVHANLLNRLECQPTTSKSLKDWLLDLKMVVIDIEDGLDLILTLDLDFKVNGGSLFQRFTRLFTKGDDVVDVVRELKLITCRRFDEIMDRFRQVEFEERCANPLPVAPALLKGIYHQIPNHLRPCFALCAVYRKGHPLIKSDMINMWMALGLLEPRKGIMSSRLQDIAQDGEHIGCLYFEECLCRSFFQFLSYEGAKKVIRGTYGSLFDESHLWIDHVQKTKSEPRPIFVEMDDLVHDLATYMLEDDIVIVTSHRQAIPTKVMHILWNQADCSSFDWRFSQVRIKTRLFAFNHPMKFVSKPFLEGLISSLKCLRVLNLNFSEFEELPESVGELKHLRHLNLCWNLKLIGLPESTSKLVNLQALELSRCIELERLPKDIHKLVSLRYLSLTAKLKYFPKRLFRLRALQVLRLTFCSNLICLPRAVGNLRNLRQLEIISCNTIDSLPNEMKGLTSLERLSIICCERLDLEGWTGLEGLRGLNCLDIIELPQLTAIPSGLDAATSLDFLKIHLCERLRTLGEGLGGCTSLLKLSLGGCPSLTHLPASIRKLESLLQVSIDECPLIGRRCARDGPDWGLISHIPQIIVNGEFIKE